jgi:hypothetical protein
LFYVIVMTQELVISFIFFHTTLKNLDLKNLIATCYKNQDMDLFSENKSEQAIYLEYTGDKNGNNVPDPEEIGIKHLKAMAILEAKNVLNF